ncbi:MAG: hypothetical protein LVS60_18705 [Nodosilinea sp. LVE1205-7]|jgi:chromosome segregation ATPase
MLQDSSLDFKLVQRICLLQQALDQATESLEEMQQQVANHQMLQSHLSQTEAYSNVQQKIILNLQQQLADKDDWQRQLLEEVLVDLKYLIDSQQLELERLKVRIHQSHTEVQDYLVRLKNYYQNLSLNQGSLQHLDLNSEVMIVRALTVSLSSQLQAAQEHIQEIDQTLSRYQVTFARLQNRSKTPALPESTTLAENTCSDPVGPEEDPVALRAILATQQQKIAELSTQLEDQFHYQTSLKSRCQKLAAERDYFKQREIALRMENEALRAKLEPPVQPAKGKIHVWQAASQEPAQLSRLRRLAMG